MQTRFVFKYLLRKQNFNVQTLANDERNYVWSDSQARVVVLACYKNYFCQLGDVIEYPYICVRMCAYVFHQHYVLIVLCFYSVFRRPICCCRHRCRCYCCLLLLLFHSYNLRAFPFTYSLFLFSGVSNCRQCLFHLSQICGAHNADFLW